ncbi:MAG: hypothetical protein PHE20_04040 [Patescibacteria group bacterium]|nr:hypothetical protein [Patescibacteria group bacterium]
MFKCGWLKKLLGLNKECCCHAEEASKASADTTEASVSDNVEVTEVKTEETSIQ